MIRGADDGELFVVRDYSEDKLENILEEFFNMLNWMWWMDADDSRRKQKLKSCYLGREPISTLQDKVYCSVLVFFDPTLISYLNLL